MNSARTYLFAAFALFVLSGMAVNGQEIFSDPAVDYTFAVPEGWRQVVKPSVTNPNVEYVYGDRTAGLLSVRKVTVKKDALMTDIIDDEGQSKLQFRPGYVAGKEENFAGKLRGSVFNFEYVNAGKPMAGRYYFLRAGDTAIYLLQFTGPKDSLQRMRNQTDMAARTFSVK